MSSCDFGIDIQGAESGGIISRSSAILGVLHLGYGSYAPFGKLKASPFTGGKHRMSKAPDDLKYTKTHEWVRMEGDTATVGITDFAQSELGDIVYVDLPTVGRACTAGDSLGTIESVKTVSDFYAPVSGTVTEVNPALAAQSELLNSDPYEKGYILKIQVSDTSSGTVLLTPSQYAEISS
jgi:glycine cleavage system H protein